MKHPNPYSAYQRHGSTCKLRDMDGSLNAAALQSPCPMAMTTVPKMERPKELEAESIIPPKMMMQKPVMPTRSPNRSASGPVSARLKCTLRNGFVSDKLLKRNFLWKFLFNNLSETKPILFNNWSVTKPFLYSPYCRRIRR